MKHCCLNCKHFAWWDGDYVCIKKMKILTGETSFETNKPEDPKKLIKFRLFCFEKTKCPEFWEELRHEINH